MVYWDTNLIIKLYVKEQESMAVEKKVKAVNQAIPITSLHELEFQNALRLKRFRNEITEVEIDYIISLQKEHEAIGVYYRPGVNWGEVFRISLDLSSQYTHISGSRSLDVLHVAIAKDLKASQFITNDNRQRSLAQSAGLTIGLI
jgi:predicted nucleic acid-binding protein